MFPEGREAILAGGIERGNDLIDFFEDVTCIFIDIKTFEESSFVQELSLPESEYFRFSLSLNLRARFPT